MIIVYFVLTVLLVSTFILYRRTSSIPSKEVMKEIHGLIDDIASQSNLLEQNIRVLQLNVDMLNSEVDQLKERNANLSLQIKEIGESVKEALNK